MGRVDRCTDAGYPFVIDGAVQWLSAIPYGDPREGDRLPPDHCHDCGVTVGSVHHWGCDVAVCPNCDHQFLGCECHMPEPGDLLRRAAVGGVDRDPGASLRRTNVDFPRLEEAA